MGAVYSESQIKQRYNEYAKKNNGGLVSFDNYKKIVSQKSVAGTDMPYISPRPMRPSEYITDEEGNQKYGSDGEAMKYSEAEYKKLLGKYEKDVADYDNKFFAEVEKEASEKLGVGSVRKAPTSGGGGDEAGYSERVKERRRRITGAVRRREGLG